MNSNIELEAEVIEEIRNGRKVSAIKKLRELRGIDLKEAKELVDLYNSKNNINHQVVRKPSSGGGIMLLIFFGVVCYMLYKFAG